MPVFILNQQQLARVLGRKGASGLEIAEDCRVAGNIFCAGASTEWSKEDLVAWLRGPYAAVTSYTSQPERMPTGGPGTRVISAVEFRQLLESTLREVYDALERGMHNCPPDFVRPLIRDQIIRSAPRGGEAVWFPVDRVRLSLGRRVLSLFAVDKLVRPEDYVTPFALCARCGSVLIGQQERAHSMCAEHDRPSGRVPRGDSSSHDDE